MVSASSLREESTFTEVDDPPAKLCPLDKSYVECVLRKLLDELSLIGVIIVDPAKQAQELTQSLGEDVTALIERQKLLEKEFAELVTIQPQLRRLPNKQKLIDNQLQVKKVSEQLKQSTKQLCRNLKDNPNVAQNMAKSASERQNLQLLLNKCLGELGENKPLNTIYKYVTQEESNEAQMRETIQREKHSTNAVKQLKIELKGEREEHIKEMRDEKKNLSQLKQKLKTEQFTTEQIIRFMEKDTYAATENQHLMQQTTVSDLTDELNKVKLDTKLEKDVHSNIEIFMNQEEGKIQDLSEDWKNNTNISVRNLQDELETLKINYQRDLVHLQEMEAKYKQELQFKEMRDEKELQRQNKSIEAQIRQEKIIAASIKIQAIFRGWKTRNAAAGGKKGKKGKKKGKKK